ncbi:MAG: 2-isopropylmalate synthase [Clostridiales bacterium]|nr:2-isopropylmalate synthase [Clostridiales bacterium]
MQNSNKYEKQYFTPNGVTMDWMNKDAVDSPPIWCSVDLRDGNQALIVPMSLEEKLEFFTLLCKVGFKEIEIGFPAASETEYEFCRALIERNLIPDDVKIQVLTQAREHIIQKTFEAIDGAKHTIVHLYNSTSVAQREQVFKKSKAEIVEIAKKGAELCLEYKKKAKGKITFEYSPESFTGTEPEFAVEICNEVLNVWRPTADDKAIINLPVTVSLSMPHVYANQVEYMSKNLLFRENVILSLHPHNDRGCAVADSEMGLLAGGERIEGTLFGNGERTGNVDVITLALNMYSHGIDPKLDFSNLPEITETYEKVTRMRVYERQPYSGRLVFAAFSGSHQDAIAKGIKFRTSDTARWTVPYLPIDPADIGREYEADVIRINSQSGKGGIGYILETQFKLNLPAKMRETFGYHVKSISDREHRELSPDDVHNIFLRDFTNLDTPLDVIQTSFGSTDDGQVEGNVEVSYGGKTEVYTVDGIGGLNCVSKAIKLASSTDFALETYVEHALDERSTSKAASYVSISRNGKTYWGAGIDSDIFLSSVKALVSAVNVFLKTEKKSNE